ncbi:MAG: hypothetical protein M1839_006539 [Geoglossum umbratile]|nr:MAG: hypothetical protein M1839_006539 [Geoglossum umbratile]
MAPSGMFSYLRPHHKRSSSGPKQVSPLNPSSLYSTDSALSSPDFQTHSQLAPPRPTRSNSPHSSTPPVSPLPPVLPQIPRVASTDDHRQDLDFLDGQNARSSQGGTEEIRMASNTLRPASRGSISTGTSPNALLGVESNASGNRPQSARSAGPKESLIGNYFSQSGGPPPLTHSPVSYSATSPVSTYYSSSIGNHPSASTYPTPASSGRPVGSNSTPSLIPPPRSGRAKLNLLNPMSLLMRRRANHPVAHLADSAHNKNPPILGMSDDYDPRIRGKIVHDFSAPRLRIISEQGNLSPSQTVGRGFGFTQTDESGRRSSATQDPRLLQVDVSSGGGRESPLDLRNGEHTPIFKEHFGDGISDDGGDVQATQGQQEGRGAGDQLGAPWGQWQNTTISASQAAVPPPPDRSPPPPPGAKDSLPKPNESLSEVEGPSIETTESAHSVELPGAFKGGQGIEGLEKLDNGPVGLSLVDSPAYGSSLPKHFKSNASRFSFEVSGIGSSSQEKLLEEAHRKTMAKKRSGLPKQAHSFVDEFDERFNDEEMGDFDYYEDDGIFEEKIPGVNSDAIEDDGAFEEEIPGVNSDAVEDDGVYEEKIPGANCNTLEGDYQMVGGISGFDFGSHLHSPAASPQTPYSVNSIGVVGTPRDADGRVIGFALSKESPTLPKGFAAGATGPPTRNVEPGHHDGLGLAGVDICPAPDDDELYFDDGIIEAPLEDGEHAFDESVFDNEDSGVFGLPPQDLMKPVIPDPLPVSTTANSSPVKYTSDDDENDSIVPQDSQATDTTFPPMMNPSGNGLGYQASLGQKQLSAGEHPSPPVVKQPPGIGLTQDNLTAYHNALVAAANAAAINGKLSRRDTASSVDLDDYEFEDPDLDGSSHPGLIPDSGRVSEEVDAVYGAFPPSGVYDGLDDFDYDDGLEDDPIIAEANAEALASDDEGFYGSEFGFYAHAAGSGEAEYVAGGYFGPRGGVTRTMSGRMREPNLTPITERSECSNRTSFAISLHGPPVQPGIASPGLAQLVDMMGGGFEDDEMNLNALRKLRRGAWGGSNGSLRSSGSATSQPGASPLSFHPPLGSLGSGLLPGPSLSASAGPALSLSNSPRFPSPNGYASDQDSAPASPTITLGNHTLGRWGGPGQRISGYSEGSSAPGSPLAAVFNSDPVKKPRHRREGSGGDSIAYMREEGEDGERWVLERRRTDEFGEVEIVGREVVEGGRI